MSNLQPLCHCLGVNCGEAAWADHWLSEAIPLIQALSASEWQELRSLWPLQAEQWQARFAQLIEFGSPTVAAPLLVEMLLSASNPVAVRASESLRSLGKWDIPSKPQVTGRLRELADQVESKLDQLVIIEFLHLIEQNDVFL